MVRRALIAVFFGVGLVTVGCIGAEDEAEDLGEAQQFAGGGGFLGDNHYSPSGFQANTLVIRSAAAMKLMASLDHPHYVSLAVADLGLFNTPAGVNAFEQAVSCGLKGGDYVTHVSSPVDPHGDYYGGGYMLTTIGWRTTPLTPPQREDLFTCMITRLNPSGQHVTIDLGGPDVAPSNGDTSVFTYPEAVWTTTEGVNIFNGQPTLTFTVRPSPELLAACGGNISLLTQQMTGRTCPTQSGNCGLQIITDTSSYPNGCTGSDMNWTCGSKPAIQTKLKPADMPSLYPKCAF